MCYNLDVDNIEIEITLILKAISQGPNQKGILKDIKKTNKAMKVILGWCAKKYWDFDLVITQGWLTDKGFKVLSDLIHQKFLVSTPLMDNTPEVEDKIMRSILNSSNMLYDHEEDSKEKGPFYGGESLKLWMDKRLRLDQIKMFAASTGKEVLFIIYDLNTHETHIFSRSEYEQIKDQLSQIPLTHFH